MYQRTNLPSKEKITTHHNVTYLYGYKQIGKLTLITYKPKKGQKLVLFMSTMFVKYCVYEII